MTAKNRLTRLEAAWRPRRKAPDYDISMLTEDEVRFMAYLPDVLTEDEAAAAEVIYKKMRLK